MITAIIPMEMTKYTQGHEAQTKPCCRQTNKPALTWKPAQYAAVYAHVCKDFTFKCFCTAFAKKCFKEIL